MLRRLLLGTLMVMACALFTASRAKADAIDNFTFKTGADTYTWMLPASPVLAPDAFSDGIAFGLTNVAYSLNGTARTPAEFDFFSLDNGGGFDLLLGDFSMPLNEFGLQAYKGMEGTPTFLPGTYLFLDPDNLALGSLKISAVSTPEPGVLVLTGFGLLTLIGMATRKKRGAEAVQLAGAC
jgi:hypothetical protein